MKVQLTYEQLKDYARETATYLKAKYPDGCHLVAIARGGVSFGHLVAYHMAQQLFVFYPKPCSGHDVSLQVKTLHRFSDGHYGYLPVIFLEDLIAEGRTLAIVQDWATRWRLQWEFIPVVVDGNFPEHSRVNRWCTKTLNWIVMPHEDFDAVREGDHGMFREGTSENSKPLV